ncbi:MAG: helicase-related protein [Pontixanthobacter sp.]
MCAHSSGAMGFPLRLLAREVYDRVVAIKGEAQVALITGEERIVPPHARYFLCTAEAMPRIWPSDLGGPNGELAFVALDEAQLGGNRERGHIFTDHFLHSRGRDETLILGAATLEPLVRGLLPHAEIVVRPRFSTLAHIGPRKLSRLPPRSAIVAFSAEQVYAVAEMLRRFRGGSAVVMGALSPETRNRQVELFQSGQVDYIVATDAIGMGLNLDITHVAFASLQKFDGVRQRRLLPAEMAQIAGRAGRHQKDGTFGTLSGLGTGSGGGHAERAEFSEEEIYAIEEHRFAPLTRLFWRDSEPRFDTIPTLIADLERVPHEPELQIMPETVDLAILKRLSEEDFARDIRGRAQVRRFWDVCSLPDFRQQGAETHSRFVARLWQDLRRDYIGADFAAARIAELDNMAGDIHVLQGRIAAIRSWAYICQRPDWVLARDEMAARARAVEAKLSDALHARLTERFVNRRTAILMKSVGQDPAMLPVSLGEDGTLCVEDEAIGRIDGFRFTVDPMARHEDRKMLLAAGERALPRILGEKARGLAEAGAFELVAGTVRAFDTKLATIDATAGHTAGRIVPTRDLMAVGENDRQMLLRAMEEWLAEAIAPLAPLTAMEAAMRNPQAGSQARALLLALIEGHGYVTREQAGIELLPKELRPFLRRLGVTFGALDIFAPLLLKPAPRGVLHALGLDRRPLQAGMAPVVTAEGALPSGYRRAGTQYIRIDIAEKLLKAAHLTRSKAASKRFVINPSLAISTGLKPDGVLRLMEAGGFRHYPSKPLSYDAAGPPGPGHWEWKPGKRRYARKKTPHRGKAAPAKDGAFAALADLL